MKKKIPEVIEMEEVDGMWIPSAIQNTKKTTDSIHEFVDGFMVVFNPTVKLLKFIKK